MILALDVHYREIEAIAVGVLLHWEDAESPRWCERLARTHNNKI